MERVSYSSKSTFEWCPRQYRYKYVDRVAPDRPQMISTIVGSACHKVINKMYLAKNFDLPFILDLWPASFSEYLKREKYQFPSAESERRWVSMGRTILSKFHVLAGEVGILKAPIKTEWKFSVSVVAASGRTYDLIGIVDLIVEVGGEIWIIDFKTGVYKLTEAELLANDQVTIYDLAVLRVLNLRASKIGFLYPRHKMVEWASRTELDHKKLIEAIDADWMKIQAKNFDPTYVKCHLCSFQDRCAAEDASKSSGVSMGWFLPKV
jgi:hypothetical protein